MILGESTRRGCDDELIDRRTFMGNAKAIPGRPPRWRLTPTLSGEFASTRPEDFGAVGFSSLAVSLEGGSAGGI